MYSTAAFHWALGGAGTDDHFGPGPHEPGLEPIARNLLGDQGGVFLDIGAHVGHYTILLGHQASHVIAVEANPDTVTVLKTNIELNGLTGRVTVLEIAAWDERCTLRLDDPNNKVRGVATQVLPDGRGQEVQAAPLDELLAPDQPIRFVKMDVEGADLHVLRGLDKTLRRERPPLFIERHDHLGCYDINDMYALLSDLGYQWSDAENECGGKYLICVPVAAV